MKKVHLALVITFAALFAGRVIAQLVQERFPVAWLPSFDAWHGGFLPYWGLLSAQVTILAVMGAAVWRLNGSRIDPRRWKYLVCYLTGSIYFVAMGLRFIAGLTILSDIPWFTKSIPALFHIFLASFVLVFGRSIHAENLRISMTARSGEIPNERQHV